MAETEPYDPSRYELRQHSDRLFEIIHEHGSCSFMTDPATGQLDIEWLEVDEGDLTHENNYRRRGIGKNMLRYTLDVARDIGARTITATIISRESLSAMTRVFGEDSIRVKKLGRYDYTDPGEPQAPHQHTRAFLEYCIEPTELPEPPTNG
jgi:GNAT superfamily N-acetyltransferase